MNSLRAGGEGPPAGRKSATLARYPKLRTFTHAALALAALTLLGATPPPVTVSAQITRTSLDLLDSLGIEVVVHNPNPAAQTVKFAQPSEYAIDIVHDKDVLWTSAAPSPPPGVTYAAHSRTFNTGPTTLVIYEWNGLTRDGWCPPAGSYAVRVRLLDGGTTAANVKLSFAAPLPAAGVAKLKPNEEATLAGTLDASRGVLTDSSGSIALLRHIVLAPPGKPLVLRGYPTDTRGGTRVFTVERWAPLGPPAPPTPSPSTSAPAVASPSPKPTRTP